MLIISTLIAECFGAGSAPRHLRSASELDYPPFAIVNEDGSADGFSVDLLRAVVEEAGMSVSFTVGPWHEIKTMLEETKLDVLPLVSYSQERDRYFDFAAPYLTLNGSIFIRRDNHSIRQPADLHEREVLVMRGDTAHEYALRNRISDKLILTDSYEEAFKLLSAGYHDAIIVQQIVGLQIIKKLQIKNVIPVQVKDITSLKPVSLPLDGFTQNFCFAVSKGQHRLLSALNGGLAAVFLNGTYDRIYEKWFSPILPEPEISIWHFIEHFLIISGIVVFCLTIFGVWYLKRAVNIKTGHLQQEIAHRREIENDLAIYNERCRKAQAIGKVGNWEYDMAAERFWCSQETARLCGLQESEEIVSFASFKKLFVEQESITTAFVQLLGAGTPFEEEVSIVTADRQKRRVVSIIAEPISFASGKLRKIHGVILDISERRKSEEALLKSQALHQTILQAATDGFCVLDKKGNFREVNDAYVSLSGYSREELQSMDISKIEAVEKPEIIVNHLEYIKKNGSDRFESKHFHKNGSIFNVEVSAQYHKGHDGIYIAFVRDITPKLMELEERKRSEDKFRKVFLGSPDAISIVSLDNGIYVDVNDLFLQTTGYTREEVIGCTSKETHLWHSLAERARFLAELEINGQIRNFETKLRMKSGELRYFIIQSEVIELDGKKCGLNFMRDVNRLRIMEKEKEALQAHLLQAQKMEAIGTLAGGIAHDFNNILGVIYGYADMAKDDAPANSILATEIDHILEATNRAKSLVRQILTFSREAKAEQMHLQIADVIKDAIKLLRPTLPVTIDITTNIERDVHAVQADPMQVHQIIMNLATNAFHAMEDTGGTLTINLQNRTIGSDDSERFPKLGPGEYVELMCADDGPGISAEVMERMYDPYFTTKGVGKGTGLGLSIIHGLVKSYHGAIACDSQLGLGTTFTILFPAAEHSVDHSAVKPQNIPTGREHILFVDDEALLAQIYTTMLSRLGYTVTAKTRSFEALYAFSKAPYDFDLVITDQTMPEMTGLELVKKILAIRPDMPIILCTGYNNVIPEDQFTRLGVSGFALKPLSKLELAHLIRKVIDG